MKNIYLIEVAAYTGSAEEVFRFSTGLGYTSKPTDTPANTYYQPRVEQPGLFKQNMFDAGKTSGSSTGGYGEIVLINTDGGLDTLIDYGFDGRVCTVKQGVQGAALSTFATVITGTVEQCEVSWNRVTLRLKDRSAELAKPIQTTFYAGTNTNGAGVEGTSDLLDKPKPRLFGKCNNVTPICCNTSKLIYQVNTSAVTIPAAYDNGVLLTEGAAYADQSAMEATAPTAGQYRVWTAGGMFRLGSSPAGDITADVVQGATAADRTVGQIVKTIVAEHIGADVIVAQSIIDLDNAAPYVVGYYTGADSVNVSDALDTLCGSVGAWWGFDNAGLFWSKQLQAPAAAQSLFTLTEAEILTLDRTATGDSDKGLPTYKINVDFSKNWTVQKTGLAGSVQANQLTFEPDDPDALTTERRNLLAMEYLRISATDSAVQTKHLLSPELTIPTLLDAQAAAQAEADRLLIMRKSRRDRLAVSVPMGAIQYPAGGYWDDEAISEITGTTPATSGMAASVYGEYLYLTGGSYVIPIYEPTTNFLRLNLNNPTSRWSSYGLTAMPTPKYLHSAVVYNGYLYVIGGRDYSGVTASVIRLDLSNPSGSWDDAGVTDLPAAREQHCSVVHNGYLYVIGGFDGVSLALSSVIRLDLSNPSGSWDDSGVTDLPAAICSFSANIYSNFLIVCGGFDGGSSTTSSVIRLDLSSPSGSWDDAGIPDMPVVRRLHASAAIGNYLYVVGGSDSSCIKINMDILSTWEEITSLPTTRYWLSAAAYEQSLYVIGGQEGLTTGNIPNTLRLCTNDNPGDTSQLTSLGRTINIKYPRYGYDAGRPMRIIGTETDLENREITLELWG